MKVEVRIGGSLRKFAGGRSVITLTAPGSTPIVDRLAVEHAELHASITASDGRLLPFVRMYLNQHQLDRNGAADRPLADGDVVNIITAVAGG